MKEGCGIPIPVTLGVLIKGSKHDRKDDVNIVADEVAEILIVPEI